MVNLSDRKTGVDCRSLVSEDIGAPKKKYAKSWMWLCPFHSESDPSFSVTSQGFHCFGCGRSGDHFDWLREYRKLSWSEAKTILNGNYVNHIVSDYSQQALREPIVMPPSVDWQQRVSDVVRECQTTLWSDAGKRARNYLVSRGFSEAIIHDARLGYLPGGPTQWRKLNEISVPCGITIPWFADGELWALKVRRAAGKPKYQQVAGGINGALYGIDGAQPGQPLLIVEGELNALATNDIAGDLLTAVSIGGASSRINRRWFSILAGCSPLLTVFDDDEAGNAGAERLDLGRARRVRVIGAKDINELLVKDAGALRAWLEDELRAARRPPPDFAPAENLPPLDDPLVDEAPKGDLKQLEMIPVRVRYF